MRSLKSWSWLAAAALTASAPAIVRADPPQGGEAQEQPDMQDQQPQRQQQLQLQQPQQQQQELRRAQPDPQEGQEEAQPGAEGEQEPAQPGQERRALMAPGAQALSYSPIRSYTIHDQVFRPVANGCQYRASINGTMRVWYRPGTPDQSRYSPRLQISSRVSCPGRPGASNFQTVAYNGWYDHAQFESAMDQHGRVSVREFGRVCIYTPDLDFARGRVFAENVNQRCSGIGGGPWGNPWGGPYIGPFGGIRPGFPNVNPQPIPVPHGPGPDPGPEQHMLQPDRVGR